MEGKGGGGDRGGIKTVESLRGRLLAEREESKAAKTEADLMDKRLGELERQLAEEIKSRNRAEKRLEYALKKLKSLKLSNLQESSQSSSEGLEVTSGPGAGSSGQPGSQGVVEETTNVVGLKDAAGSSSGSSAQHVVSQGSWSSVGTAHSQNKEEPVLDENIEGRDYKGLIADDVWQSSLDTDELDCSILDNKHSDNALALVPVESAPPSSTAYHRDTNSSKVQDVLLALRHVKKQLWNSMGRRTAGVSSRKDFCDQRVRHGSPISS